VTKKRERFQKTLLFAAVLLNLLNFTLCWRVIWYIGSCWSLGAKDKKTGEHWKFFNNSLLVIKTVESLHVLQY
jgi:hypothetical protein